MTSTSFTCDCGCGAQKGEGGSWWLVRMSLDGFGVFDWSEQNASSTAFHHAAGEGCIHSLLGRWLEAKAQQRKAAPGEEPTEAAAI